MSGSRRDRFTTAPSSGTLSRLLSFYGTSRESNAMTNSQSARSLITALPVARDSDHDHDSEQQPQQTPQESWELQAFHRQGVETMARNGAIIVDATHPGWPYDRDNPMNWQTWLRIYHTVAFVLLCSLVMLASATYAAALIHIEAAFGVSFAVAIVPLSLYFFGLAIGSPIAETIMEVYGRRHLNLGASLLFLVFTVAAGCAPNFAALAVFRFLSGVMGSAPVVIVTGTMVDLWPELCHCPIVLLNSAFMCLATILGFMAGGYVVTYYGNWRWTMWTVLFAGTPIYIFALLTRETCAKAIVKNRARRLNLTTNEDPATQGLHAVKALLTVKISSSLKMLFTEVTVALGSLHNAYIFSFQYCLFTLLPKAFMDSFLFTVRETSQLFIGVLVAVPVGTLFVAFHERVHVDDLLETNEEVHPPSPKKRLTHALVGSFCVPFGTLWLGWVFQQHAHWFNAISSLFFVGAGVFMVNFALRLYLAGEYGVRGPRAAAASDLVRYALAGILPFAMRPLYERLGAHWALTLLGGFSVVGFLAQIVIRQFPPKHGE